MKTFTSYFVLSAVALSALARPAPQTSQSFTKQNGIDAINLNKKFQTLTADSSCDSGENACVNQEFAQCVDGKFVLTACSGGLICAALPLVNSAGTSITCTTQSDVDARIAATGATDSDASSSSVTVAAASSTASSTVSSSNKKSTSTKTASSTAASSTGDLQTSLCLDQSLVQTGFEEDGQQTPATGQVASLTSGNNYINFCATTSLPLTNGQQVKGGSCNAAPMGIIASTDNMPSSKFVFPVNTETVQANTAFTVKMAVKKLTTGNFVNAAANYFSAPQQIDSSGNILGHSHIVIEKINGLKDTTPTDPTTFEFFKGLNDAAEDGVLSAEVTDGLAEGTYRIASINSAANHQPVLVAVAQHGSLDDMVYFTVTASGNNSTNNSNDTGTDATSTSVAATSTSTSKTKTKTKGTSKTSTTATEEATATTSVAVTEETTSTAADATATASASDSEATTSTVTTSSKTTSTATDEDTTATVSASDSEETTSSTKKSSKTSSTDDADATETATATEGSKDAVTTSKASSTHTMDDHTTSTVTRNAVQATSSASGDDDDDCM